MSHQEHTSKEHNILAYKKITQNWEIKIICNCTLPHRWKIMGSLFAIQCRQEEIYSFNPKSNICWPHGKWKDKSTSPGGGNLWSVSGMCITKEHKKNAEVAQSCLTLCNPMDCSLPGSSIHGIFQARILEWVAISFSRRSSWPRDWTRVSCIVGRRFTIWATREVKKNAIGPLIPELTKKAKVSDN